MIGKSFLESVAKLFDRDLNKLEEEIRQYPDEASVWLIRGDIKNPAGNLCLHLCGNLQHYIGAVLGGSGYIRNRDNEFAARNLSREALLTEIRNTRAIVNKTLSELKEAELLKEYPEAVFSFSMSTMHFLIHLLAHLGYHLGQVNYHKRLAK